MVKISQLLFAFSIAHFALSSLHFLNKADATEYGKNGKLISNRIQTRPFWKITIRT